MHPDLTAVAADTDADARLLERIADWCQRYTPLAATDPPDGILLDITGCAHLFGGERALLDDLTTRVAGFGFVQRAAIAGTIGAASAAARFSRAAIVAPGGERDLLLPLPLAALRLEPATVAALRRVGLKRIGDIVDLPRAPLAARFGSDLLRQLDRALGRECEPLTPILPVAPFAAEQRWAEPVTEEEEILAAVAVLARRLEPMLEGRGQGARRLALALFRTDGAVKRVTAGTSQPLRTPDDIAALFKERLAALADAVDPGFGFDVARLSVLHAERSDPEQIGLGKPEERAEIDRLVDRLSARLAAACVARPVALDSHMPERAAMFAPAQAVTASATGWSALREGTAAALAPRPLRLLAVPEPIEAIAEVPDGPPLRFSWRRAVHDVVAAEGPERIEDSWWNGQAPARDYFRVEDKAGLRFWIFRAGLYRDAARTPPRWFLHGLFG